MLLCVFPSYKHINSVYCKVPVSAVGLNCENFSKEKQILQKNEGGWTELFFFLRRLFSKHLNQNKTKPLHVANFLLVKLVEFLFKNHACFKPWERTAFSEQKNAL